MKSHNITQGCWMSVSLLANCDNCLKMLHVNWFRKDNESFISLLTVPATFPDQIFIYSRSSSPAYSSAPYGKISGPTPHSKLLFLVIIMFHPRLKVTEFLSVNLCFLALLAGHCATAQQQGLWPHSQAHRVMHKSLEHSFQSTYSPLPITDWLSWCSGRFSSFY